VFRGSELIGLIQDLLVAEKKTKTQRTSDMEEIMRNQRRILNHIFSLLVMMGMFLSLSAPQSVIAEYGVPQVIVDGAQTPTVGSGQQDKPAVIDKTLGLVPPSVSQAGGDVVLEPEDQNGDPVQPTSLLNDPSSDASLDQLSSMVILDDFNRADGPIGSSWTVQNGSCMLPRVMAIQQKQTLPLWELACNTPGYY
jgi:hypothetical protein